MRFPTAIVFRFRLIAASCCLFSMVDAQQVTGIWEGKINNTKVELKIIQKGDSLTGTSYYYASANNYCRYAIKGYFDAQTNAVVWWDDQLITDKRNNQGNKPLLSVADFNCPGGGEMRLDGKSAPKEEPNNRKAPLNLTKIPNPFFVDEWDFVIDNYTVGGNDPYIIDSVSLIAQTKHRQPERTVETRSKISEPQLITKTPVKKTEPEQVPVEIKTESKPLTIEEKFASRKKVFTKEITVDGDSVELRFYDNAEIDGDSISLFLNQKMIFTHVRLTDKPYTIKLSVKDLNESNELTMVAENLGSIPPNTSYMVAIVGKNRYDAYLASTENSSAMIRLRKLSGN